MHVQPATWVPHATFRHVLPTPAKMAAPVPPPWATPMLPALVRLATRVPRAASLPRPECGGSTVPSGGYCFCTTDATTPGTKTLVNCSQVAASTTELHLDRLGLTHIAHDAFTHLSNLRLLALCCNELAGLDRNLFTALVRVEDLGLDQNNLQALDLRIFSTLTSLLIIHLENNNFSSLRTGYHLIPLTFEAGASWARWEQPVGLYLV